MKNLIVISLLNVLVQTQKIHEKEIQNGAGENAGEISKLNDPDGFCSKQQENCRVSSGEKEIVFSNTQFLNQIITIYKKRLLNNIQKQFNSFGVMKWECFTMNSRFQHSLMKIWKR